MKTDLRENALQKLAELENFQRAARTPDGAAVMEHLRLVCGADKSTYRPGDPHATSFACGLREAFLMMTRDMNLQTKIIAEKLGIERSEK